MSKFNMTKIYFRKDCYACYGRGEVEIYDYFLDQQYGDLAEFEKKPCHTCKAKGFLRWCIDVTQAETWLEKMLKSFDWYYDYSDSGLVKRKARLELSLIKSVLRLVPEELAALLWNKYCPYNKS